MLLEGTLGILISIAAAAVVFVLIWKIFKNVLGAVLPAIALFIVLWLSTNVMGTVLGIVAVFVIFVLFIKVFKKLLVAGALSIVLLFLLYFMGWL